jgi:hypothetical protein
MPRLQLKMLINHNLNLCYLLIALIGTFPDFIEDCRAKDEISVIIDFYIQQP